MDSNIAMYKAIAQNEVESVQQILANDPAVLHVYFLNETWLHHAAQADRTEIMKVLVHAGLAVDVLRSDGTQTPLDAAAGQGHLRACEWLLDNGADINFGFGVVATPIFGAVYSRSLDMVKLLVRRGADLTATFGRPQPKTKPKTKSKTKAETETKIDVTSFAASYGTTAIQEFLKSQMNPQK
jgi:ankyrin repeat protein